eukprot:10208023-Lingulodinium_polyedra.AAC.1
MLRAARVAVTRGGSSNAGAGTAPRALAAARGARGRGPTAAAVRVPASPLANVAGARGAGLG